MKKIFRTNARRFSFIFTGVLGINFLLLGVPIYNRNIKQLKYQSSHYFYHLLCIDPSVLKCPFESENLFSSRVESKEYFKYIHSQLKHDFEDYREYESFKPNLVSFEDMYSYGRENFKKVKEPLVHVSSKFPVYISKSRLEDYYSIVESPYPFIERRYNKLFNDFLDLLVLESNEFLNHIKQEKPDIFYDYNFLFNEDIIMPGNTYSILIDSAPLSIDSNVVRDIDPQNSYSLRILPDPSPHTGLFSFPLESLIEHELSQDELELIFYNLDITSFQLGEIATNAFIDVRSYMEVMYTYESVNSFLFIHVWNAIYWIILPLIKTSIILIFISGLASLLRSMRMIEQNFHKDVFGPVTGINAGRIQADRNTYVSASNSREDLSELAREINYLLEYLSNQYPLANVPQKAVESINQTPQSG